MSDENVDYGPLTPLIGAWRGDKGMDTAPEPDGTEQNPYYETIVFEAIGDVDNAETQELAVLRYHQCVYRKSNDKMFHNESGYLVWDADAQSVMQMLTIPRGVSLVAGGTVAEDGAITVRAGDADWPIAQSPFMRDNARTVGFEHHLRVEGDTLTYDELTRLEIYGRAFDHTDSNRLTRA